MPEEFASLGNHDVLCFSRNARQKGMHLMKEVPRDIPSHAHTLA